MTISIKRSGENARNLFALSRRSCVEVVVIACALILLSLVSVPAQTSRVVVIKVDGLSQDVVDDFVRARDARTGKSYLPWIKRIFYENGSRVKNFYARGLSLSAPSWSLLDTGQHLQIKGNVEYNRWTLDALDYLNFFPFYINYSLSRRVDMPGVTVLDDLGVPLLIDAYPRDERYLSFQIFQRGARWRTLQNALQKPFRENSPRELFDEWTIGYDYSSIVFDQLQRELIERLNDPRLRYLDYFDAGFDHAAHASADHRAQLYELQRIDAFIGRVWTAIERTPLSAETALVIVSDHGINTDERIYSQGYNLVNLLGSRAGGGHHVVTNRYVLAEYAIKGLNPLVTSTTSAAPESYYLKGQSASYPTALLDLDGNERASIHLRNNDLNQLHILLQQLRRRGLAEPLRRAATDAFFSILDRRRASWSAELAKLKENLVILRRAVAARQSALGVQSKKLTASPTADNAATGSDIDARRPFTQLYIWQNEELNYSRYERTLKNLLTLRRDNFDPSRLKTEDVIAPRSIGDPNTIYDLQNYTIGLSAAGLVLDASGNLDAQRSFTRVNYFSLLKNQSVRNNVQPNVSSRPVDFIAARLPRASLREALKEDSLPDEDAIWLYGGENNQALVLARHDAAGRLLLSYMPVSGLTQDSDGRIRFTPAKWRDDLPLKIWEDEKLHVTAGDRAAWLSGWHTDAEWLRALHETQYSNGLIGIHEQFSRYTNSEADTNPTTASEDVKDLRRLFTYQRTLVEADMQVFANNHWNFKSNGFNPGGNHGSFLRASTHSTLMFAGGERTGIPRGLIITEPYDSLSFAPTLLTLTDQLHGGRLSPALQARGFHIFPGRVIGELFGSKSGANVSAEISASPAP